MKAESQPLRQALRDVKTVDPHCHLNPHEPGASHLADLLLYHHVWIELVSSGMDQYEVTRAGLPQELSDPEIPARERVRRALPYLPNIRNTTVGTCLRWLMSDLYGVGDLNAETWEQACAAVEQRASDPDWQRSFLADRCRIVRSITVEPGVPSEQIAIGDEHVLENIADGKRSPQQVLEEMERAFGREIRNADDYCEHLAKVIQSLPVEQLKFINVWPTAYLTWQGATPAAVSTILRRVRQGRRLGPDDVGLFAYFGLTHVLDALRTTPVRTVQFIVGAEVLPPHRAITQWGPALTGSVARLANAYGDFHFSMSTASDAFTQDLGILAKHLPNVSVAGYWWHTLYPYYIRKSLEARLDMVPLNKIIGFFSDAYHAEWCYPKLRLVKEIVGDILEERVARGWYSLELALDIVQAIFYDNPCRIYGVS